MVTVLYVPPPKRKRFCVSIQIPKEPVHFIDPFDVPTLAEIIASNRAKAEAEKKLASKLTADNMGENKCQADVKEDEEKQPIIKPVISTSLPNVEPSAVLSVAELDSAVLSVAELEVKPLQPKPLSPKRVIEPSEVKRKEKIQTKISGKGISLKPKKAIKRNKRELSIAEIKEGRKFEEDFIAQAAHELRFWKAKLKQEASQLEEKRKPESPSRLRATRLRWWDSIIGIRNHEVCWLREDPVLNQTLRSRPRKLVRKKSPRTAPISRTQLEKGFEREEYMSSDLLKSMSKIRQKMELSSSSKSVSPRKSGNKASRYHFTSPNRNVSQWKFELKTSRNDVNPSGKVSAKMLHKIGDWINLTPSPRESLANSPSSKVQVTDSSGKFSAYGFD